MTDAGSLLPPSLAVATGEWLCLGGVVAVAPAVVIFIRRTISKAGGVADGRRDLRRRRRRMMREAGMCPDCGHTVRVATDRCPECGSLAYSTDAGDGD